MSTPVHTPLAQRLQGKRVCVCVGAGGVGKTTVSAALALGLALQGLKVAVVSIDPARRLAGALGLGELPGEPHPVDLEPLTEKGAAAGAGELWAMMLDSKGTFDRLVGGLAPDARTREEVLANRIYRELSGASAGSQEFTAVAQLFELERDGRFDAVVLDTPPSRNALDFLDAPDRLRHFLEGRALRVLLPGGARGLVGRGAGLLLGIVSRATGVNLVGELSSFFGSLAGLTDGFSERARSVERLLRDPATSFLIVTSPEREPAAEARFLHERLAASGMAFGGLVVNRVHDQGLSGHAPEQLRELLCERVDGQLAAKLAANLADFDVLARREGQTVAELCSALEEPRPTLVPQLDGEVQDLAALGRIAERLLGEPVR